MKKILAEWRNFIKVQKVNEKVYKQYASRLSEKLQQVFWDLSEDQKVFVVEDWINQGRPADHLMEDKKSKEDFKPHMMYDPKTGKGIMAKTYDRHIELDKKGFLHEKPKVKEEKMADLNAEEAYSTKVRGVNVIINLKDTDLQATKHSKERQYRHDEKISNRAIVQAVELAIGKIIQDYANG